MKSKCKGPWLHRFSFTRSGADWEEETCQICHTRTVTKIRSGRTDNYSYLSTHLRSALQKWHPRFKKEYETI